MHQAVNRSSPWIEARVGDFNLDARQEIWLSNDPGGEIEVVADIVGGPAFPGLLDLLARGGRYVTSGAIAGPLVELDLRILYLKDLELRRGMDARS